MHRHLNVQMSWNHGFATSLPVSKCHGSMDIPQICMFQDDFQIFFFFLFFLHALLTLLYGTLSYFAIFIVFFKCLVNICGNSVYFSDQMALLMQAANEGTRQVCSVTQEESFPWIYRRTTSWIFCLVLERRWMACRVSLVLAKTVLL